MPRHGQFGRDAMRGLLVMLGKTDGEYASCPWLISHAHSSSIGFAVLPGNGQPKTQTTLVFVVPRARPEHDFFSTWREASAVVFDVNEHLTRIADVGAERKLRTWTGELEGVLKKVAQCAEQTFTVPFGGQLRVHIPDIERAAARIRLQECCIPGITAHSRHHPMRRKSSSCHRDDLRSLPEASCSIEPERVGRHSVQKLMHG